MTLPAPVIPLGVGVLIWILFGGLALVRREQFPTQLTLETLGLTVLWLAVALTSDVVNPIAQFVVTYLVIMRSRIVLDLANFLSRRGNYRRAMSLIAFAERLGVDPQTRFIADINRAVVLLRAAKFSEAQAILEEALAEKPAGMHPKFEAALRFNLGVAHEKAGHQAEALKEYRQVLTLAPGSMHAHGARTAINRAMGGKRKR